MARARDLPPDEPPPDDYPTRELPRDDPSTRELPPDDTYARDRYEEEVYEEPLPPEEPPWWRNVWIWLLVLLIVVLGGLALIWFLQRDTGESDRVTVPAVVGQTAAQASNEIQAAGLEPILHQGPSDRQKGIVFSQAPGGGSQLKKGEPVVLNISTGQPSTTTTTITTTTTQTVTSPQPPPPPPASVTVADVVGQGQVDAGQTLESNGLVADSYPVPSDEPAGTVVSQSPSPGTTLKEGDTVRLNVSLGPGERDTAEIPDVTGLAASRARHKARVDGFTVRTVLRQAPSQEEVGEVLTQSPAAGTTAPVLTQMTIYVGR
jgi:serine/threonine-protein kinase